MNKNVNKVHFIFISRFATKEPNGLLIYNGRFNEKHDFIAMEIINEQIQLTFSAGRGYWLINSLSLGFTTKGCCFFVSFMAFPRAVLSFTCLIISQVKPRLQSPRTSSEASATACGTWWRFTTTTRYD